MKKILAVLALIGAAVAGAAMVAKKRDQDLGEFAGEWADRAKEVASSATDTAKGSAESIKDVAIDLRDELSIGDRS